MLAGFGTVQLKPWGTREGRIAPCGLWQRADKAPGHYGSQQDPLQALAKPDKSAGALREKWGNLWTLEMPRKSPGALW